MSAGSRIAVVGSCARRCVDLRSFELVDSVEVTTVAAALHPSLRYDLVVVPACGDCALEPSEIRALSLRYPVLIVSEGMDGSAIGLLAQSLRTHPPRPAARALTPREHQTLLYLAQGLTLRQAAVRMGVRTTTADTYLKRIREKLGPGNRAMLVRRALQRGELATAEVMV